jgi:SAM-dependent methyltransferase
MAKKLNSDGQPYEDQESLRSQISTPFKQFLAWYVNKTFNGGLLALNKRTCDFLEPNSNATVLDVGTGDGETFLWWGKIIGSTTLHAMDAIENKHKDAIKTFIASLDEKWPVQSNFYDVVISSQNIEHIIDTPLYMNECNRVLKPGGYFIILTENLSSWANIFATIMGWLPFSFSNMFGYPFGNKLIWHASLPKEDFSEFYEKKLWGCLGHQRLFTPLALRHLGEKYGFRFEKNFAGGYLPFWGLISKWLCRMDPIHAHFIGIKLRKK